MTEGNGEVRELPKGWCRVSLGDIAKILPGFGFPKEIQGKTKGKYPFFKFGDISKNVKIGNKYLIFCDHYADDQELERSKGKLLPKNSIVFAKIGEALKLNRRAILKVPSLVDNNVVGVKCLETVVNYLYLFFYLKTIHLEDYSRATTVPSVRKSDIEKIGLPLSPFTEQLRIVEKIEELFSDLDQGVESLKTVQKQLKVYRQVVLKWAFEGKLTEKWRSQIQPEKLDIKTGKELLAQIKAEREKRYQQKLAEWEEAVREWEAIGKSRKKPTKPSKPKDTLSLTQVELTKLSQLPDSWCWARVDQVGNVQLGRQRSPQNRSKDFPTQYIRAANITENGLDLTDVMDMEFKPHEFEQYQLKYGDIVLSEASGSAEQVGKPALWRNQIPNCCFQNTVVRFKSICLSSEYFLVVFKNFYINGVFSKVSTGVGINHLSANKFSAIPVPLPPVEEQEQILQEIESRLSICDQLESTIAENLQKAEALRQSILKQAFEGKLVPQDPNDKPAEKLLERIKQEKLKVKKDEQLSIQGV